MLFGGQLASILVCEKCKKVSVTYEDFNDLSLSIKPEDYAKDRKRDRFKKIARKLRIRPPTSSAAHEAGNGSASARSRKPSDKLWTTEADVANVRRVSVLKAAELTLIDCGSGKA